MNYTLKLCYRLGFRRMATLMGGPMFEGKTTSPIRVAFVFNFNGAIPLMARSGGMFTIFRMDL